MTLGKQLKPLDECKRLFQFRKKSLFSHELSRMYAAPIALEFYRVPQVQHLVVHEILDRITRDPRVVKDPADHDRVVRGVIVTETLPRGVRAPHHVRPAEQAKEESVIQRIKDLVQVIDRSTMCSDLLSPTHLPDQMGLL